MQRHIPARTRVVLGVAVATALVATAGCTSSAAPSDEQTQDDVSLTIAIVPDPAGASEFYREQFDLFEEANPGIEVEIVENPADQQNNAIELMFQQGNAPDVFRAQGTALDLFNGRGWVEPLDEYVTDDFLARFPEGSMEPSVSGLHRDGKLASVPLVWGDWGTTRVLLYNKELFEQAGYDEAPETWGELDEAVRTITEEGGGGRFGFALDRLAIMSLLGTAAPDSIATTGIDLTRGEVAVADQPMEDLVDWLSQLQKDRVLEPGWETWSNTKAYEEFAAGRLASYVSATWHVAEIEKLNPELDFGVAAVPVPDDGREAYLPRAAYFQPIWSMSSESEHKEEAWKLLDFLGSVEFYTAYFERFGTLTATPEAWEGSITPHQEDIVRIADETVRTVPNPQLSSAGGAAILAAIGQNPNLHPSQAALTAIIAGQAWADVAPGIEDSLNTVIDEVPDASRDDITFSNWDPMSDYGAGD